MDKSVSKNDAIFCNPMHWIAKNGIVFAYRQVLRPAARQIHRSLNSKNSILRIGVSENDIIFAYSNSSN
jgi:hypothetical protein